MPLSVLVTNRPPEADDSVPEALKELFQEYTQATDGQVYPLFRHQAEVFRMLAEDREVFLVAGTAAGKTLAVAVPLFQKLREGRIRKVLLMYPTIALMDDQRRVMDKLAEITGLEVGQLRGGLSRTELIAALNKPVILATPDEVYWFFRKNIKYSSLLIYGLALVNEFVLDEAHLFNGLMLRNLSHLKRRVQLLGEKLGRRPRWHVLTATPTPELRSMTEGIEVQGQSKCSDVTVTFLEPAVSYAERQEKLVGAVETALADEAQKVLLVFNSADLAHRVFEDIKGKSPPDLPPELKWRFGRVRWGDLKTWMEQAGIEDEIREEIERRLRREGPFLLKDLAPGTQVALPMEALAAQVARLLEAHGWGLKRLVYQAARAENRDLLEVVEGKLMGKRRIARLLWDVVKPKPEGKASPEAVNQALDARIGELQAALERALTGKDEALLVTAPDFTEITILLQEAGLNSKLAGGITEYLKHTVEVPEEAAVALQTPPQELARRQVAFSWLEWWVRSKSRREAFVRQLQESLAKGELAVETRHIATWKDTGIPVVIYTGKMTRNERKGLIEAFAGLPRAVLISTPAVEVGVDFAADTLITEQCDGNGFLQRFGRVGRRPGIQGRVTVLLRDGETYVRLYRAHQPQMTREAFSTLVADPDDGLFPARRYVEGSTFLDATHWLVNAQLGEIGSWLNQTMFGDGATKKLAQELWAKGLPFAYGLRGTMPGVGLRGGAGGGEPFYILRKVPNERLISSDSPFEMAQAEMWYLEFLWTRSHWKIVVDVRATLESGQAHFWWRNGQWHLRAGYGIVADYVKLFSDEPVIKGESLGELLEKLEPRIQQDLEGLLAELSQADKPVPRLLTRIGKALPLFFEPHARFILGQGDVHLLRVDQDEIADAVEDRLGNPLVLPDQTWLLLYGHSREKAEALLEAVSGLELEEIFYDWETLETQGSRVIGPVLLDRVSGACFDVYRRLVTHVGGAV
ncbi:MAG: hypothetical protein Kow0047_04540 [Anaerolineae bacterium]